MKVICYIRVSTTDQADHGVSLEAQRAKLQTYAALYDLEIVNVFEDAGESAKSLERPGLQLALESLRTGAADGLLIPKLDRLTRNVGDWQRLIDEFFGEKAGKQLFSVADSIDTRTAAGRLVLNVLLSVAQWEREIIAERTKEAIQHKIRNGQRVGRIRFGFDLASDGKSLVPNPAEQDTLDLMNHLKGQGYTLRAIANELQSRGIPTKDGKPWVYSTIGRILNRAA